MDKIHVLLLSVLIVVGGNMKKRLRPTIGINRCVHKRQVLPTIDIDSCWWTNDRYYLLSVLIVVGGNMEKTLSYYWYE